MILRTFVILLPSLARNASPPCVINMKIFFFHVCNLIKFKGEKYNWGSLAFFLYIYIYIYSKKSIQNSFVQCTMTSNLITTTTYCRYFVVKMCLKNNCAPFVQIRLWEKSFKERKIREKNNLKVKSLLCPNHTSGRKGKKSLLRYGHLKRHSNDQWGFIKFDPS